MINLMTVDEARMLASSPKTRTERRICRELESVQKHIEDAILEEKHRSTCLYMSTQVSKIVENSGYKVTELEKGSYRIDW